MPVQIRDETEFPYTVAEADAIVSQCYTTGEPLYSRVQMVYGDSKLKPGDQVFLLHGRYDSALVRQGKLIPLEAWQKLAAKREQAAHESKLAKLRQDKAIRTVEAQAAEAALESAKQRVAAAVALVEAAESAIKAEQKKAPAKVE